MKYTLRRPCQHCPFRTDVPGYLRRARCVEIAESIAQGATFPCHKTVEHDDDEDGEPITRVPDTAQMCAGAMIVLERLEQPNQAMRVAERLGLYDPGKLDMAAPVVAHLAALADHHEPEEMDPCSVADPDCEAPAGMLVGGVVTAAEWSGTPHMCEGCGEPVCDACCVEDGRCPTCASYDE